MKPFCSLGLLGTGLALVYAYAQMASGANPLETYVKAPDPSYSWKQTEKKAVGQGTAYHLEFISQTWRGQFWSHHLQILRPATIRHPELAFLYITGDGTGEGDITRFQTLAERVGTLCAVLTKVPNQPLYDGRKEDALVAYTLDQYFRTGDETWPLLFPMVKSAVRAMDTVQAFAEKQFEERVERFVVSGASKRGWTTWLTATADSRVSAIAPMVIDVLNMKAQLHWAERVYGRQSEQIHDYTELRLHEKLDDLPIQKLRGWIDPYAYAERYTMPKLLLLGTNDPYWTVDSLRHYWNDLPEPKLVFQTPNAGHDLAGGDQALQTLAAWYQLLADGQPLPKFTWKLNVQPDQTRLTLDLDQPVTALRLWTASSTDRDFRNDKWSSQELRSEYQSGHTQATVTIVKPASGYRAFLVEAELTSAKGKTYLLSTEARVVPDQPAP